jgi:outer membrane protein assembly factor BamA
MPMPGIVWASRVQGASSLGKDAQRFWLGGPADLRGWDRRELAGLQTVLVQEEVRFPVLRGLTLAVPSTWVFPTISAAAFVDAAWGWEQSVQDRRGGAGFGAYVGGGYFPAIRWNYVWVTRDFENWPKRPRTQFFIGFNF